MRNYFLNVIDKLLIIDEEVLKEYTEKICKNILLDEKNFISKFEASKETLKLKDIIIAYAMLIKQDIVSLNENESYAFYIGDENINNDMKNAMLVELFKLLRVCNIKVFFYI